MDGGKTAGQPIDRLFRNVQDCMKALWNKLLLIFGIMLVLPVWVGACSPPDALEETDQPHALIGADEDTRQIDVLTQGAPVILPDLSWLPGSFLVMQQQIPGVLGQGMSCAGTSSAAGSQRLHRRLCRELC